MSRQLLRFSLSGVFAFAIPLFAQSSQPQAIPSDRSDAVYTIYSAVVNAPALSHPDTSKKALIEDSTGFKPDPSPLNCLNHPPSYRSSFEEILMDFSAHKSDSFHLERKLTLTKPYELLNAAESKQFEQMTVNPSQLDGPRDQVDKFRGGTDLIRLGNVYLNRKQSLAIVHTQAFCGGLCGFWTWRVFEKTEDGRWNELHWRTCVAIASNPSPRRILVGDYLKSVQ